MIVFPHVRRFLVQAKYYVGYTYIYKVGKIYGLRGSIAIKKNDKL